MSIAEQKKELLRVIHEADAETTAKLIDFVQTLNMDTSDSFTTQDLAEFERRRQEFIKNPDGVVPWEESLSHLRKKLAK